MPNIELPIDSEFHLSDEAKQETYRIVNQIIKLKADQYSSVNYDDLVANLESSGLKVTSDSDKSIEGLVSSVREFANTRLPYDAIKDEYDAEFAAQNTSTQTIKPKTDDVNFESFEDIMKALQEREKLLSNPETKAQALADIEDICEEVDDMRLEENQKKAYDDWAKKFFAQNPSLAPTESPASPLPSFKEESYANEEESRKALAADIHKIIYPDPDNPKARAEYSIPEIKEMLKEKWGETPISTFYQIIVGKQYEELSSFPIRPKEPLVKETDQPPPAPPSAPIIPEPLQPETPAVPTTPTATAATPVATDDFAKRIFSAWSETRGSESKKSWETALTEQNGQTDSKKIADDLEQFVKNQNENPDAKKANDAAKKQLGRPDGIIRVDLQTVDLVAANIRRANPDTQYSDKEVRQLAVFQLQDAVVDKCYAERKQAWEQKLNYGAERVNAGYANRIMNSFLDMDVRMQQRALKQFQDIMGGPEDQRKESLGKLEADMQLMKSIKVMPRQDGRFKEYHAARDPKTDPSLTQAMISELDNNPAFKQIMAASVTAKGTQPTAPEPEQSTPSRPKL